MVDMENKRMTLKGQAICKDCGNGTLNNELLERFLADEVNGVYCVQCGGNHIDGELYEDEVR